MWLKKLKELYKHCTINTVYIHRKYQRWENTYLNTFCTRHLPKHITSFQQILVKRYDIGMNSELSSQGLRVKLRNDYFSVQYLGSSKTSSPWVPCYTAVIETRGLLSLCPQTHNWVYLTRSTKTSAKATTTLNIYFYYGFSPEYRY